MDLMGGERLASRSARMILRWHGDATEPREDSEMRGQGQPEARILPPLSLLTIVNRTTTRASPDQSLSLARSAATPAAFASRMVAAINHRRCEKGQGRDC